MFLFNENVVGDVVEVADEVSVEVVVGVVRGQNLR